MNGNATIRHAGTALLAITGLEAPVVVPSMWFDEQLEVSRKRLRLPRGLLQRVAGVHERRWWDADTAFDDAAIAAGITVTPIPGASAILAALVASGLSATAFTFLGFLPRAATERRAAAQWVLASPHTVVLYEAPPRVADLLQTLAAAGGAERRAVAHDDLDGAVAICIGERRYTHRSASGHHDAAARRASALREEGTSVRDTVRHLQKEFGVARNEAYRLAQGT